MALNDDDKAVIAAVQAGLPLVERPYAAIAEELGMTEDQLILTLSRLVDQGQIKRFGVVVRHHELGYRANAMVVWDVPDEQVAAAAAAMVETQLVSLCYRRPRRPGWPYNLFCMLHGRSREETLGKLATLRLQPELAELSCEVLFSTRRFKQRGARYHEKGEEA
ncbi:MAG TPA: hypothetical protein V6D00_14800 [Pantanalinema sp.]